MTSHEIHHFWRTPQHEARAAYRSASLQWHPDRNPGLEPQGLSGFSRVVIILSVTIIIIILIHSIISIYLCTIYTYMYVSWGVLYGVILIHIHHNIYIYTYTYIFTLWNQTWQANAGDSTPMAGFATFSSLVRENFSQDPWKNISKLWEVVSRSRSMLRIGRDLSSAIQLTSTDCIPWVFMCWTLLSDAINSLRWFPRLLTQGNSQETTG